MQVAVSEVEHAQPVPWAFVSTEMNCPERSATSAQVPLIVGLILAAHLNPASVLIVFGGMQNFTGLIYRMPMPAQPLKAMAVLVISQKLSGSVLYGAGLSIGIVMLFLSATGLIDALARIVPKVVVRGIQFGLGLQLSALAFEGLLPGRRGRRFSGWRRFLADTRSGRRYSVASPGPFPHRSRPRVRDCLSCHARR